jgi:hypothetical protein
MPSSPLQLMNPTSPNLLGSNVQSGTVRVAPIAYTGVGGGCSRCQRLGALSVVRGGAHHKPSSRRRDSRRSALSVPCAGTCGIRGEPAAKARTRPVDCVQLKTHLRQAAPIRSFPVEGSS